MASNRYTVKEIAGAKRPSISLIRKTMLLIVSLQLFSGCAELPKLEVMSIDNVKRAEQVGSIRNYFFLDSALRNLRSMYPELMDLVGINSLGFSPDGTLLAWGDAQGNINVWRMKPLRKEITINAGQAWVHQIREPAHFFCGSLQNRFEGSRTS